MSEEKKKEHLTKAIEICINRALLNFEFRESFLDDPKKYLSDLGIKYNNTINVVVSDQTNPDIEYNNTLQNKENTIYINIPCVDEYKDALKMHDEYIKYQEDKENISDDNLEMVAGGVDPVTTVIIVSAGVPIAGASTGVTGAAVAAVATSGIAVAGAGVAGAALIVGGYERATSDGALTNADGSYSDAYIKHINSSSGGVFQPKVGWDQIVDQAFLMYFGWE